MFCPQCGAQGQDGDRFCSRCGAPLRVDVSDQEPPASRPSAPTDWSDMVDYRALIAIPEVQARLASATAQASTPTSAADFVGMAEKAMSPQVSLPVSAEPVMRFVQPIYARMGINTGKTRTDEVPWAAGRVIVAVLCSLARHGVTIGTVHQAADGVVIEGSLPSSALALKTTLLVTIGRGATATSVQCAVRSEGQLYDWGRSKRALQTLFDDIAQLAPADVVG